MTTETRDRYTAGHQHSVTRLACVVAKQMGLLDARIEAIRLAATIHDIGKIYVPAEILSKPGRLTDAEFPLIKAHARVGVNKAMAEIQQKAGALYDADVAGACLALFTGKGFRFRKWTAEKRA